MRELVNEVNGASKVNLRPDIAKWVEALRSGEYRQAKGALQVGDGFCCLGVYCKIKSIEFNPSWEDPECDYCVNEDNWKVYKLLRETIPELIVDNGIDMNDRGRSFDDIADMIEKYYTESLT